MIGNIISAGASLLGGLFNRDSAKDAAAEQNRISQENAAINRKMQEEFAKNAIQWKVNDARSAGVHPLYALGATTHNFAPVSVGAASSHDPSMGNAIAAAGQDLGRAMNANATAPQRADAYTRTVQGLQVQNMELQNQLLASKVRTANAVGTPPAFPGPIGEATKPEERPLLQVGGSKIETDPLTSNQEEFEKRYGDDGPVSWATQAAIAWRDLNQNLSGMTTMDILRAIDRKTRMELPDWIVDRRPRGGPPQWR